MVSLRAPYLAAGELAGRIYPRLAHLTLESPNAFRALSIDACLPALTHLTHLALKLRNRLQPELDHLQAALPHLDATQVSRSGRFYHRPKRAGPAVWLCPPWSRPAWSRPAVAPAGSGRAHWRGSSARPRSWPPTCCDSQTTRFPPMTTTMMMMRRRRRRRRRRKRRSRKARSRCTI